MMWNRVTYFFENWNDSCMSVFVRGTRCGISLKQREIFFYKKFYSTSSRTFQITMESQDEQRPVLVSAHSPPKIRRKILYRKCYSTPSRIFLIKRESEDEQRPVLVSAHPPPKITLHRNLNTLPPNMQHSFPGWQMKDICHTHLFQKIHF